MPAKEIVKHKTHLRKVICYKGDMLHTQKTRNEVSSQGQSDPQWNASLGHPKIHPRIECWVPTSNNIGDMLQTLFF